GYHAQVAVLPDSANVFLEMDAGRERLVREGGGWALKHSGRRFADGELRALLDAEPGRFSPNVLLRPVVESAVFPTVAYVAGPGAVRGEAGRPRRPRRAAPPPAAPRSPRVAVRVGGTLAGPAAPGEPRPDIARTQRVPRALYSAGAAWIIFCSYRRNKTSVS